MRDVTESTNNRTLKGCRCWPPRLGNPPQRAAQRVSAVETPRFGGRIDRDQFSISSHRTDADVEPLDDLLRLDLGFVLRLNGLIEFFEGADGQTVVDLEEESASILKGHALVDIAAHEPVL